MTGKTTVRERLQREVVRSSRTAFDLSEKRLQEGTIDLVTLLNTQQTLFQAQDVLAQDQFDRLVAVEADVDIVEISFSGPSFDAPIKIYDTYDKTLDITKPGEYSLRGGYQLAVRLPGQVGGAAERASRFGHERTLLASSPAFAPLQPAVDRPPPAELS